MTFLSSSKVTTVTKATSDQRENGLRILASLIVRAYLGEIDHGEAGPEVCRDENTPARNKSATSPRNSRKLSSDMQAEAHHE